MRTRKARRNRPRKADSTCFAPSGNGQREPVRIWLLAGIDYIIPHRHSLDGSPVELFDTSSPAFRPIAVREAILSLAGQGETERGAVFTRPEVVSAILDLAEYVPTRPLHEMQLLEPSFGDGCFLFPVVDRLLASATAHGVSPYESARLAPAIRAVEIHPASFASTREGIHTRLLAWGAAARDADTLCDTWLVRDDFLLTPLSGEFDFVVGNPPYVRQERIPGPLLNEYRRRFSTIYDRADLYVPFIERGLRLLRTGGRLAFICANRWLKNKYGRPLRELVAEGYHLAHYIDMEGTDAFHSEVITYPSITIIERGKGTVTRVARRPEVSEASLSRLVGAMLNGGPRTDARIEDLVGAVRGGDPWLLDESAQLSIVRRLEESFSTLEETGCKVGIGVATGADRVFIGSLGELPVEPERKLPLAMAKDLVDGRVQWSGKGVVNPFEADGSLARLDRYPRFRAWAEANEETIGGRHCAQKNPSGWYRTIDRIWPELTTTPKLLIPDIKGEPTVAFDEGRFYPHHNLYHVTSSTWDLRALATVLRSSVAVLLVASYCIRMAGGFLRFQAQYLRRMRIPRWEAVPEDTRLALIEAAPGDLEGIDKAVFSLYGFSPTEAKLVREFAQETRVKRKTA